MSTLSVNTIKDVQNFDFANTSFASAFGVANASYNTANVSYTFGNTVYAAVNSAFAVTNAAFARANTALQNANTTLVGSLTTTGGVYAQGLSPGSVGQGLANGVYIGTQGNYGTVEIVGQTGSLIDFGKTGADFFGRIIYDNASNTMSLSAITSVVLSTVGTQRLIIDSSGSVGIGTSTPYATLEITPSAAGWGEGIVINPSSSGYSGIFFRKAGTSGSNVANTWSIGKSTGTPERLQVLINGLTGGVGVDRGDAIQQWKTNGDTLFGFNVGVGMSSPTYRMDVTGPALGNGVGNTSLLYRGTVNDGNNDAFEVLYNRKTAISGWPYADLILRRSVDNTNNQSTLIFGADASGGTFQFNTVSTERMRIDSSGRVTTPAQPRFCVRTNVLYNAPASTTEMVHTSIVINVGSHYNTSTGRFTAPIAGYYRIWTCFHSVHTSGARHHIAVNGGQVVGAGGGVISSTGDWRQTSLEYQVLLAAGDYISTFVWGGNYIHGDPAWGNWGAELIG
jgi:hypothetical protein